MATAEQERNLERVRAGLDAFNRGDHEQVLAVLADDVEIFASAELLNAGSYHGHDGYRAWVEQWLDVWEGFEMAIDRIEPIGDRHVVVAIHQRARGRGSGIDVDMDVAYMFELRDEVTSVLHLYPRWDEAVAEAERRASRQ